MDDAYKVRANIPQRALEYLKKRGDATEKFVTEFLQKAEEDQLDLDLGLLDEEGEGEEGEVEKVEEEVEEDREHHVEVQGEAGQEDHVEFGARRKENYENLVQKGKKATTTHGKKNMKGTSTNSKKQERKEKRKKKQISQTQRREARRKVRVALLAELQMT